MSQFMVTPKKPNLPPTPMSYCKTSLPPLSSILKKESVPMTPSGIASVARLPSIDSFTTPSHEKIRYHSPSLPSTGSVSSIFPTPMIHKHHSAPQLSVITTPSKNAENVSFSAVNSSESDITPNESLVQSKSNSPVESKAYAFISHSPATFPNQEPSIDNAPLARRKRRRTSPNELSILNKEFDVGSTPNKARRIEISKKVQMTEKAVQIWFQNKRQALRKHSTSEKEVTELPLVSEPAIISASTPIKPQLNKSHSFVSPTHQISESPMQKRSFSTGALNLYNKANVSQNESDISDDSINTSRLVFAKGVKVKDEEISNLVLNKTKKKQPNFLNSGNSSTMTFKLAPAKCNSPKKEERKPLGDININTIQGRVGVKLEHTKKENENECVQNLLALRAANWS